MTTRWIKLTRTGVGLLNIAGWIFLLLVPRAEHFWRWSAWILVMVCSTINLLLLYFGRAERQSATSASK